MRWLLVCTIALQFSGGAKNLGRRGGGGVRGARLKLKKKTKKINKY